MSRCLFVRTVKADIKFNSWTWWGWKILSTLYHLEHFTRSGWVKPCVFHTQELFIAWNNWHICRRLLPFEICICKEGIVFTSGIQHTTTTGKLCILWKQVQYSTCHEEYVLKGIVLLYGDYWANGSIHSRIKIRFYIYEWVMWAM